MPHLDHLVRSGSSLAVATALPEAHSSAYTPLRDRVLERVEHLNQGATPAGGPWFRLVVCTASTKDPNAGTLAAVTVIWHPWMPAQEAPGVDLLHMAVQLWTPARPGSPYEQFEAALRAVSRVCRAPDARSVRPSAWQGPPTSAP